ncbi:MAG TPA: hypothetical protein VEC57_15030 [Candidatus Limnocylindrales bacterium]|nr:hypothetical protein [Candidatus Limnocylindrales bacterium]
MPSPLEAQPALPPVTSAQPIRSAMDKALSDTLAKLPPSSGRGFVQVDATNTGARVEGAVRAGGVRVAGWVGWVRHASPEAGVRARWDF